MTITGFATTPFGTTHYGTGYPGDPGTVPSVRTDGVRFLDPVTGNYTIDAATGQFRQISRVMQQVLLAVRTAKGSSAVRTFGYSGPRKMGTSFEADVDSAIRLSLRHLTDEQKAMVITKLEVERSAGRYAVNLGFDNLETGASEGINFYA
jgi:hypothetical protein